MTRPLEALLAVLLLTDLAGCARPRETDQFELGGFRYHIDAFSQWKLPKDLREISGLAFTPEGRLYAHGDERAVVHEIDWRAGAMIRTFGLGDRPPRDDFEGIAAVGANLYLVTSDGDLYVTAPGTDGASVPFTAHATGLGADCEVEGLTYQPADETLLLVCKTARSRAFAGQVVVVPWSLESRKLLRERALRVPERDVLARLPGAREFNPSGIEVSPKTGTLLVVAARQRALLELTAAGDIVAVFRLIMAEYHPQTEGIAQLGDGTLILADEGGNKRGRIGVYRAAR